MFVELQPRLEEGRRSKVGGSGPGVEAGTTFGHHLVSETSYMLSTPMSAAAGSELLWCDKLTASLAGSTASCSLQLISEPAVPIFPPLSADGAFVPGSIGGS